MKWLSPIVLLLVGLCAASEHSSNSACKAELASIKEICGTTPSRCRPRFLSDCVNRIRDIRGLLHSISSADYYCAQLSQFIKNHSCERKTNAVEVRHLSGLRGARSPSTSSIQKWRNQLQTDLHREVHTMSQGNESCYHALHDNCLRHVSCRELWKIFRQLCTVDAQNQCQMTSKEDCWQSFEGISWTGLGTCTCYDDNSDCHWIRLQTSYNKCIYEIVQGHEQRQKYGQSRDHSQSRESHTPRRVEPIRVSVSSEQYSDHWVPVRIRNDKVYATPTTISRQPQQFADRREYRPINGQIPNNARRIDQHRQSQSQSRERTPTSGSQTDVRVENAHSHQNGNGRDRGSPPNSALPDRRGDRTDQRNNRIDIRTSNEHQRYNIQSRDGHGQSVANERQRKVSENTDTSYSNRETYRNIPTTPPPTTTTQTPRTVTDPSAEQRRRQHELFLQQQRERQSRDREYAEYKRRMAERRRQRERIREQNRERQKLKNHNGAIPTEFSSTASVTIKPTAITVVATISGIQNTEFSSTSTSTTQFPSTKHNPIPASANGELRPRVPIAKMHPDRPTLGPPSWRFAQALESQPSSSSTPQILTTEVLTTNLERPPTSSALVNVSSKVESKIRRLEENGNEDDEEENYGGGLHFYSDVIFSRRDFKQSDEVTYNESTCNRAHIQCAADEACVWHLSEVQMKCTLNEQCDRDLCGAAIQRFTQYVPKPLVEAMMFCHCMVSDEECVEQQQWMYPRCLYAEQRDIGPITCTEAVEKCRSEANCEHYSTLFFQLCNSERGQCTNADLDRCRQALIEVRATFLEFPCYCVQSDLDCRRIQNGMLPNNPCVEKSMMAYSRQLEDMHLKFTPNPSTTINSNVIEPSTTALTATSNRTSTSRQDGFGSSRKSSNLKSKPITSTEGPPRRTSTATTSGRKVELEIAPENKKFNKSKYELGAAAARNGTQKSSSTRVPLINYTSEELKDREPMPEGGCYTKNSVGAWIRHYKDTIIRKGLEWSGRCTSWCECDHQGELSCHSLRCLENTTCPVEDTVVYFGERLYLRDRGACTCCSEGFVCQLPRNLEPMEKGLYVFAGYSQKEVDELREQISMKYLERSGFVSAHRDVARDISSQLQQALERVMPLTEKCRLVLLEHYLEEHIIMHQVQWYGINRFGNDTKPKWQTGMLEKICSPYVRKLASVFEVNGAGRYQLVLSVVKQLKVIDMLDSVPASSALSTVLQLSLVLVVSLAQFIF